MWGGEVTHIPQQSYIVISNIDVEERHILLEFAYGSHDTQGTCSRSVMQPETDPAMSTAGAGAQMPDA